MLTPGELRTIVGWADAAHPHDAAGRALRAKLAELIQRHERGPIVFRLELAIGNPNTKARRRRRARGEIGPAKPWAPTLNEYNGLNGWAKASLREAVDWHITAARQRWPSADMGIQRLPGKGGRIGRLVRPGKARRRLVMVTRESTTAPDEISADVIGGKLPIDRLVQAGILLDDSDEWCVRDARWQQTDRGAGRVVIEVFELAAELTKS